MITINMQCEDSMTRHFSSQENNYYHNVHFHNLSYPLPLLLLNLHHFMLHNSSFIFFLMRPLLLTQSFFSSSTTPWEYKGGHSASLSANGVKKSLPIGKELGKNTASNKVYRRLQREFDPTVQSALSSLVCYRNRGQSLPGFPLLQCPVTVLRFWLAGSALILPATSQTPFVLFSTAQLYTRHDLHGILNTSLCSPI